VAVVAQIVIDVDEEGNAGMRPCALPPGIVILHLELTKASLIDQLLHPQPEQRVLPAPSSVLKRLNGNGPPSG
jgi:hypothetical protein